MARTGTAADVQPIDRLEEKVRHLVDLIAALRAEKAAALDDAAGLRQEVTDLSARLADSAHASAEVSTLREEREIIRTRVTQMIATIDKLNL